MWVMKGELVRLVAYVKKTSSFGDPCMCGYMELRGADGRGFRMMRL